VGLLTGPGTPYITPEVLKSAPTGIDWTTIPNRRSGPREQYAEQSNICLRATGLIEGITNQPLRATLDTEYFDGPDWRVTVRANTGVGRLLTSRWPILAVVSGQVSPQYQFPRNWQTIALNQMDIEFPPIGLFGAAQAADVSEGGQAILLAPGLVNWSLGRSGWRYVISYINGWPHTSLTQPASAGDTEVQVDDCTGWAPTTAGTDTYFPNGATGIVYDGFQQEVAQALSTSVSYGPGTITLTSPLQWPHDAGTLFTTLSRAVMNATIDMCSALALERGATATEIQSMSGGGSGGGGPVGPEQLRTFAENAVKSYARVI
jgi:hypothetical protein